MAVHIGKLIGKKIKEAGMSKSELGRRISITPQNTHYILKRNSLDTELLRKISLALDYDFFQHYLGLNPDGKLNESLLSVSAAELKQELTEVKKEIETLETHNGYLREIVKLLDPNKSSLTEKQRKLKK